MDDSRRILRLNLDGRWTAEELGTVLRDISDLYNLRLFLGMIQDDYIDPDVRRQFSGVPYRDFRRFPSSISAQFPWWPGPPGIDDLRLARFSESLPPPDRLEVERISKASPGITDLAGVGEIVGHVKDFIKYLIDRRDGKKARELAEEKAWLDNQAKLLENAKNYIAVARELGYSDAEIRDLMLRVEAKQRTLARLIDEGKITDASIDGEKRATKEPPLAYR